jgi:hypothetical protein
METAIGNRPSQGAGFLDGLVPERVRRTMFLAALERGLLDSTLDRVVVEPFERMARRLSRLDRWLCGAVMPAPQAVAVEEAQDE